MTKRAMFTGAAAAVVTVALAGGAATAAGHEGFGGSAHATAAREGFGGAAPALALRSANGPSVSANASADADTVGDYKFDDINVRWSPGTEHPVRWTGSPRDYLLYHCSIRYSDGHVWDYIQRLPDRQADGWVRDDLVSWPGRWTWC